MMTTGRTPPTAPHRHRSRLAAWRLARDAMLAGLVAMSPRRASGRVMRRRWLLVLAGPLVGLGTVVPAPPASAQALPAQPASPLVVVPGQFVAKLYSEALGRMPDPSGWRGYSDYFSSAGCSASTLRHVARQFYNSQEFLGLGYGNPARVLALYRGALNREPDQGGLDAFVAHLESGALTWPQVVDSITTSREFAELGFVICRSFSAYHYGTQPAPVLKVSGPGFAGGTGQQLQAVIDAAPAGGTVLLASKAVVRVTTPLIVREGKTLATYGDPQPSRYALQGRLVRASPFAAAVVVVETGAHLRNVWVDGQRGSFTNYVFDAINVRAEGGSGTEVAWNKISNSLGGTSLGAVPTNEPCNIAVIANLVTAYSSEHFPVAPVDGGRWTDGLSIACENALVRWNAVIDATDVGIVIFRHLFRTQRSQVIENAVLSAGNSAYGALVADGLFNVGRTHSFDGASFRGNHFWTSPNTHFDIGISVGTRPWFGANSMTTSDPGTGVSFTDNDTVGHLAVVGTGIAVSGMFNATVQGNNLAQVSVQNVSVCPHHSIAIDNQGFASGNIQPGGVPASFVRSGGGGCIGHP